MTGTPEEVKSQLLIVCLANKTWFYCINIVRVCAVRRRSLLTPFHGNTFVLIPYVYFCMPKIGCGLAVPAAICGSTQPDAW